jgi:hypothetical protein
MLPWSKIGMARYSFERRKIERARIISHRILYISAYLFSSIPYIWVTGIIWLAIKAKSYFGYWPRPSFPDPQFIPFDSHQGVLWKIFDLLQWSIILVPVVYFSSRMLCKTKMPRGPLYTYLIGWGIIMVMNFMPPINFVM